MTEIRIFESTKTLEVTKTFAKAASRYGSEAYMKLRSARNDFPDFKVVVRSTAAKKKDRFKGLTYAYMEKYIAAHDDEKETAMKEFLDLRGQSDEAKEALAESCSYIRPSKSGFWNAIQRFVTLVCVMQKIRESLRCPRRIRR